MIIQNIKSKFLLIFSNAKQEVQPSNVYERPPVKSEKPFLTTKQHTPLKLPNIPSPPPSKEIFLTQPKEKEPKQTGVIINGDKCDGGRRMKVPVSVPGLGVMPNKDVLRKPVFTI